MKLSPQSQQAIRTLLTLCNENQKSFCGSIGLSQAVLSSALQLDGDRGISDDSWEVIRIGLGALLRRKEAELQARGRLAQAEEQLEILVSNKEAAAVPLTLPGEPLDLTAPNYIERLADKRMKEAITGKVKLVTVPGAIRSGRTSLLIRAKQWARDAGMRVYSLDFVQMLDTPGATGDRILSWIGENMGLSLADPPISEAEFIESLRTALASADRHTVLLLDNMDRLPYLEPGTVSPLLLALIRFRNEAGRSDSPLSKLTVVAVFNGDAWGLANSSSVMGLSSQAILSGFNARQVEELAKIILGTDGPFPWLDELLALFGGHPYLTHLFLDDLRLGAEAEDILEDAHQASGVFSTYLEVLRMRLETQIPDGGERTRLLAQLSETPSDSPVNLELRTEKLLMHLGVLDSRRRIGTFYAAVVKRLAAISGRRA